MTGCDRMNTVVCSTCVDWTVVCSPHEDWCDSVTGVDEVCKLREAGGVRACVLML